VSLSQRRRRLQPGGFCFSDGRSISAQANCTSRFKRLHSPDALSSCTEAEDEQRIRFTPFLRLLAGIRN